MRRGAEWLIIPAAARLVVAHRGDEAGTRGTKIVVVRVAP
jgi:hypothetical protein